MHAPRCGPVCVATILFSLLSSAAAAAQASLPAFYPNTDLEEYDGCEFTLVATIDAFNAPGPQPPLGYLLGRRVSSWTSVARCQSEQVHPAGVFLSGATLLLGSMEYTSRPDHGGHIDELPTVGTLP
ncbi:hypothetical protein [Povalibacter sp.]|uniref:hypothetical protein n=1 Tax=Povalibacter sp. TaxID=1962978 RepID=UPI002F418779